MRGGDCATNLRQLLGVSCLMAEHPGFDGKLQTCTRNVRDYSIKMQVSHNRVHK